MPRRFLAIPHRRQQRESDCLAACAAMMLGAIGIDVPYQRLLSTLEVQTWGTRYSNIQFLERLHLDIRIDYRQGVLEDLFAAIDTGYPPAVFLETSELPYWQAPSRHAVVVVGYDDESFYVNDPFFEQAPQTVSHGDLELAWIEADQFYAVITHRP